MDKLRHHYFAISCCKKRLFYSNSRQSVWCAMCPFEEEIKSAYPGWIDAFDKKREMIKKKWGLQDLPKPKDSNDYKAAGELYHILRAISKGWVSCSG